MGKLQDIRFKRKLLDLGYTSFKEYCKAKKINYQKARFFIEGVVNGSRSKEVRKIKNQLIKDFGKEILREV